MNTRGGHGNPTRRVEGICPSPSVREDAIERHRVVVGGRSEAGLARLLRVISPRGRIVAVTQYAWRSRGS